MDPPIISEASFSAANPSSYSLAEIWPFSINPNEQHTGNLGLRMASFTGFGDISVDESTLTEQSASRCGDRKRRDAHSEDESSKIVSTSSRNDLTNFKGKRMKTLEPKDEIGNSKVEMEITSGSGSKPAEQNRKPSEPPKDYIHVRARRGQATDSHSLAERARREKISERMKILQDLVPGCNKVIGKALVLDEIINYIQSLQHQVEFLSMKLEAVNTRMNPTVEGFPTKDLSIDFNVVVADTIGTHCTKIKNTVPSLCKTLEFHGNNGVPVLGPPSFDPAGMIYGAQAARDYGQGSQPEWLHMQLGSSFERAT